MPLSTVFNSDEEILDLNCYVTLQFENMLNPASVTANCFAVTDPQGAAEITVTDAVLNPENNEVTLFASVRAPESLACSVELVSGEDYGLLCMDASQAVHLTGAPGALTPVHGGDLYDLCVMGMSLRDAQGNSLLAPALGTPLTVTVNVVNGTGTRLSRELRLLKNGAEVLKTQQIELDGFTAGTFTFEIDGTVLTGSDTIIAKIN